MAPVGFGEVAERLRRSTVAVQNGRHGTGSGIIVGPDGQIVTNNHVIASSRVTVHLWDGRSFPAAVASRDPRRDLALLRIAALGLPVVRLADSDALRVGQLAIAIGNPLGFIGALTTGVVHAVGPLRGLGPMNWIQAAVRLAPGNSGGPLADAEGQVIGVNTMMASGLALAVPSNVVSRFLVSGAERPGLGVAVRPVGFSRAGRAQFGVLVLDVTSGAAADGILMIGDILIGAEGRPFESFDDLALVVDAPGDRVVHLQFLRGDREHVRTASIRLGTAQTTAA